jgi:long-chain acyl-CoA synthetase
VANICIYASITQTHPLAIIVPAEPALKKLAESIGVEGHGIGDLAHNKAVQREVLRQLQGVVLADEEWTPQNVSFWDEVSDVIVLTRCRKWLLRRRN